MAITDWLVTSELTRRISGNDVVEEEKRMVR